MVPHNWDAAGLSEEEVDPDGHHRELEHYVTRRSQQNEDKISRTSTEPYNLDCLHNIWTLANGLILRWSLVFLFLFLFC